MGKRWDIFTLLKLPSSVLQQNIISLDESVVDKFFLLLSKSEMLGNHKLMVIDQSPFVDSCLFFLIVYRVIYRADNDATADQ